MSFWILYIIALLPLAVGGIFFLLNPKEFTWQEWVANTVLVFIIAAATHGIAVHSATADFETWSGQVTAVKHIPQWTEWYRIQHTYTTKVGKTTITHTFYTYHTQVHNEYWEASTTLPSFTPEISYQQYLDFKHRLGDTIKTQPGVRHTFKDGSHMIAGDPNDYITVNTTNVTIPVTANYDFENRVKAASTLFSFAPVPSTVKIPDYPTNDNHFKSERLIGSASLLSIEQFDEMNSRLGPTKHVNVILVGVGDKPDMYGHYVQSKWIGGKKNDIVIVFGGLNAKPTWVYAFGWTDAKTSLRMLESHLLESGVTDESFKQIETDINQYFKPKNWHDFDYISIPVSSTVVTWYTVVMIITQIGLMWWYNNNDIRESTVYRTFNRYRSRNYY